MYDDIWIDNLVITNSFIQHLHFEEDLKEFLTREDVDSKNVISAYQLKEILETELDKLTCISNLEWIKERNRELNANYENALYETILNKSKVLSNIKSPKLRMNLYRKFYKPKINFEIGNIIYVGSLFRIYICDHENLVSIIIDNDNGNCCDELNINRNSQPYLGQKYQELLDANISLLEEIRNRGKKLNHILRQSTRYISFSSDNEEMFNREILQTLKIDDNEIFDVAYQIDVDGKLETKIIYKKGIISESEFKVYKVKILEKIPVNLSLLNGIIESIVMEYFNEPGRVLEKRNNK